MLLDCRHISCILLIMPIDSEKVHKHLSSLSRINTILALFALAGVIGIYVSLRIANPSPLEVYQGQYGEPEATEIAAELSLSESTAEEQGTTAIEELPIVDQDALAAKYRLSVNELLGDYDFTDAGIAQDLQYDLLELTVPAELKNFHLEVVIALNDALQGQYDEAKQRIQSLKEQYAWFLPST